LEVATTLDIFVRKEILTHFLPIQEPQSLSAVFLWPKEMFKCSN